MYLFCLAAISLLPAEASLPVPPLHRSATVRLGRYTLSDPMVYEDTVYVRDTYQVEAYALPSLKRKWSVQAGPEVSIDNFQPFGKIIVAQNSGMGDQPGGVYGMRTSDGKVLWHFPTRGPGGAMKVSGNTLYLSDQPSKFSAIDLNTRKVKWSAPMTFDKNSYSSEVEALLVYKGFVLYNAGRLTVCLDAANGKTMWSIPKSYVSANGLVQIGGIALVPSDEGAVGRDIATGRDVWTTTKFGAGSYTGVLGGRFLDLANGRIWSIEPKSGEVAWSHELGPKNSSSSGDFGFVSGSRAVVCGVSRAGIYDVSGKELWSGKSEEVLYGPIWTDGKHLVCYDDRLLRYDLGPMAPIPSDEAGKAKMAADMVSHFSDLDHLERDRLESIGSAAFDVVLAAFMKASAAADKDHDSPEGENYDDLGELLAKIVKPVHAAKILAAFKTTKAEDNSRSFLLQMLGRVGDPNVVVPYFLSVLRNQKTPGFEFYQSDTYVARSYISASKHPEAVKYMIEQVLDKNGDETVRQEAYWHVGGSGDAGLAAVLKERLTRSKLETIEKRMHLDDVGKTERNEKETTILDELKTSDGRQFGLAQCGILASRGDLWILEKVGEQWKSPLFLGVTLDGPSNWAKPVPPEKTVSGMKASQVKEGGWKKLIPPAADLVADDDHDGLTNIMERRLGTDPKNPDMDGDGDLDSVDPMPNAGVGPKTDAEQILAVVYEARYHFNRGDWPAVLTAPADAVPFEMVGWRGPVLWKCGARDWSLELEQCYEQGVGLISFHEIADDKSKPWADRCIQWDKTHTYAQVSVATYFGGLNGTTYGAVVRKFGDQWVVIAMRMTSVS